MSDITTAETLREIIKTCVRKLGLLQKADSACCGITIAQCHTLVEIGRSHGLSLNDLSESLTLDKSTMSRTVDNLVNSGLVKRQIDTSDRRYTKIRLTAKGSETVALINRSMEDFFQQILDSIPAENHNMVMAALPYLLNAVKSADACCSPQPVCFETVEQKGGCQHE